MIKRILLFLTFLTLTTGAYAQNPAAITSKIAWDQDATNLVEAQQTLSYKYYPDGALVGIILTSITCIGTTSPFQCEAPFPAFTPGNHNIVLTANNIAGESPKSAPPLAFTFIVLPSAPKNTTIKNVAIK